MLRLMGAGPLFLSFVALSRDLGHALPTERLHKMFYGRIHEGESLPFFGLVIWCLSSLPGESCVSSWTQASGKPSLINSPRQCQGLPRPP